MVEVKENGYLIYMVDNGNLEAIAIYKGIIIVLVHSEFQILMTIAEESTHGLKYLSQ